MKSLFVRLLLALAVVTLGTLAGANSTNNFNINTTGGSGYSEAWTYGGTGYIYGDSVSSHGGATNYSWFEVWNGNGNLSSFSTGYFEDELFKGNNVEYLTGNLSGITFNSTLGKLTGLFSGYVEIDVNGNWSWTSFTGRWTGNVNLSPINDYGNGYSYGTGSYTGGTLTGIPQGFGSSAIGFSQVPEPSSLMFMGTGLLGIAGVIRRKLKV